ncbi:MmpS family transport accessory protein [Nocardia rhizosphaerihabitans]|uniref:MmpS family transport accessory protein n=1 Tax=Nocardia rhizosphaerihabitans TaxID=1691570 RepID=UPI00366A565E
MGSSMVLATDSFEALFCACAAAREWRVGGRGAGINSVTYFDGNSELQQEISTTAPWTKSVTNDSTVAIIGLGAQVNCSSVTCRIVVDGKVADEQTSTGTYAVVNCIASAF